MTASIPKSPGAVRLGGDPRLATTGNVLGTPAPEQALDPENNAAKIVYLCTEAGGAISGQVISTTGWDISLYARRRPVNFVHTDGEWTVEELVRLLPVSLAADIVNPRHPLSPPRRSLLGTLEPPPLRPWSRALRLLPRPKRPSATSSIASDLGMIAGQERR